MHVYVDEARSVAVRDRPEQVGVAVGNRDAQVGGLLLGGVPGVMPGRVVVIGGGVVGFNAAQMAVGLGADVTILDRDPATLERLGMYFQSQAKTRFSNRVNLADSVAEADLVIGAVLIPGAAAPKLVTREMLATMKSGAVLVDVAIDQGGCFETSKATTHEDPIYVVDGIVHYCVANMPGAVPRTSTFALNNATFPYTMALANKGVERAVAETPGLLPGVNTFKGHITCGPVGESQDKPFKSFEELL